MRVPVTAFRVVNGGVSGAVNTAGQAINPARFVIVIIIIVIIIVITNIIISAARFVHFGNSAIDTIQAVPATAIRWTGSSEI